MCIVGPWDKTPECLQQTGLNIAVNSLHCSPESLLSKAYSYAGAAVQGEESAAAGGANSGAAPEATANGTLPPAVRPANSADWSEEQQLALVAAMKKFGKDTPERCVPLKSHR